MKIEGMLLVCCGPCVRQSEIFLNFAPEPTFHLVISSCPPYQPPVSLLCRATDLLHIVSLSHIQQRERNGVRERMRILGANQCSQSPSCMKELHGLNFGLNVA